MGPIDDIFIVYGVLTIFFFVMTIVILRKSFSAVNILFSLSPLTFIVVLLINMAQYFFNIPDIVPRVPYLLAGLGIFFAGVYIFKGKELVRDYYVMAFATLFIVYSLFLSIYIDYGTQSYLGALLHISITFPLIVSFYYYIKLLTIIPESKYAIITLLIGEFLMLIGALSRGIYYLSPSATDDFIPGLILVLLGIIVVIISFTAFSSNESSAK